MDQEILVKQLRKLAKRVQKNEGPLALLMVLASDIKIENRWNLIVSARGLDGKSRAAAVALVTDWMRQELDRSQWSQFWRTTVLHTDDPFVREMNAAVNARGKPVNLHAANVQGVEIPEAIVLESHKIAA
jgi:hypothetical protein